MSWVDTDYQDFAGTAANPLPGFTGEAFSNPWLRDGSGNARGGEGYDTSTTNDIESADRMAVQTTLPASAPDRWLLIHSDSPPTAYDSTRIVGGPELYYNGVYQGGYWGGGTADESLRIEDDGAGTYTILVDSVVRATSRVPTQTPGPGQNFGGMRGRNDDPHTDLLIQEWDGGGGTHYDETGLTTTVASTTGLADVAAFLGGAVGTDVASTTGAADTLAAAEALLATGSASSTILDLLADDEVLESTGGVTTSVADVLAAVEALASTVVVTTSVTDAVVLPGEILSTVVASSGDVLDTLGLPAELLVTLAVATSSITATLVASEILSTVITSTTSILALVPDPRGALSGSTTSTPARAGTSLLVPLPAGGSSMTGGPAGASVLAD